MGRIPRKAVKSFAEFSSFLSSSYGETYHAGEVFRNLLENMEKHANYFFAESWAHQYNYARATSFTKGDLDFIEGGSDRSERALTGRLRKNISLADGFSPMGFLWSFWRLGDESAESNVLMRLRMDPVFFPETLIGWSLFHYQAELLRDGSRRVLSC